MIFADANAFAASGFHAKICVIGSGPAGITVARTLAKAKIPVVLLDAGAEEYTDESQAFYQGVTIGDHYFDLDVARLRYLGGSSNHWAGWCRLLDAHDFDAKEHVPHTGWPIRRADLEPYLPQVREILELEDFKEDRPVSSDIRWVNMIKSPAVRFGERYREELAASETIAVVLNTYVSELAGDGRKITGAKLWSRGAPAGELNAQHYVVCAGGLENSRLLLWSNERSNGGVAPQAKALGRYWMEHPTFQSGEAVLFDQNAFEFDHQGDAFFSPSPEAMNRRQILNFGINIETTPYPGVKALIADLACHAPQLTDLVSESLGQKLRCGARLNLAWEQAPNAFNRVALSATEADEAGVPRIELHWKKTELERRTQIEALRLFGETLAEQNLGRVRIADWVLFGNDYPENAELAGNHHMGGTRMSDDPGQGVVDRNCRVHGMENLFVGGSSVFPTSGQCTPTTTIVALALRLGEHMSRQAGA